MRKLAKNKKKDSRVVVTASFFVWLLLVGVIIVALPSTQTKTLSFGASNTTIPFTPAPAQSNLQLNWFLIPTSSPDSQSSPPPKPTTPVQKTNPQPAQPGQPFTQPGVPQAPVNSSPIGRFQPAGPGPTAPPSNGQLCSVGNNSGKAVTGNCYCADLTVTCKNGVGYGANGKLYPGVNPCGTGVAPGSGRYCVEKPVIYLYPTIPTQVTVQVITSGSVVISDPTYPAGGWKDILANPDGTLKYNGKNYSELFYESSVTDFQKPQYGITIPTNQLAEKLSTLLDQLGLIGHEKQEFLSFWLPRLEALHSRYIFFSLLTPDAKAAVDTVAISPKPDTQIAFIAYFKAISQPSEDTLQLPATPKRKGFVSVEWGGVIGK